MRRFRELDWLWLFLLSWVAPIVYDEWVGLQYWSSLLFWLVPIGVLVPRYLFYTDAGGRRRKAFLIAAGSITILGLILDFDGPALRGRRPEARPEARLEAVVTVDANGQLVENTLYPNPVTGAWRQSIRVKRRDNDKPVELRSYLRSGKNAISETWSYLLTPE